jgi:hypothetical protein
VLFDTLLEDYKDPSSSKTENLEKDAMKDKEQNTHDEGTVKAEEDVNNSKTEVT